MSFHIYALIILFFTFLRSLGSMLKSLDESKSLLAEIQALTRRHQPQVRGYFGFFMKKLFVLDFSFLIFLVLFEFPLFAKV